MRILLVTALLIGLPSANALAVDTPPPQGAKPLTEPLQSIEKSADFGYIDEVDWDDGLAMLAVTIKYRPAGSPDSRIVKFQRAGS